MPSCKLLTRQFLHSCITLLHVAANPQASDDQQDVLSECTTTELQLTSMSEVYTVRS
jgi:hypothetical protein